MLASYSILCIVHADGTGRVFGFPICQNDMGIGPALLLPLLLQHCLKQLLSEVLKSQLGSMQKVTQGKLDSTQVSPQIHRKQSPHRPSHICRIWGWPAMFLGGYKARPPPGSSCCLTSWIIGIVWGLHRDYRGYWGFIGIMENKMETTIMGYWGNIRIL